MIRKALSKIADFPIWASAAIVVAMTPRSASAAEPEGGIGTVAKTVEGNFASIGSLLISGAFLAGAGFVVMGLFRLKAAVDSQGQQVKYSEGLWRILLGAALCVAPWVMTVAIASVGGDSTSGVGVSTGLEF